MSLTAPCVRPVVRSVRPAFACSGVYQLTKRNASVNVAAPAVTLRPPVCPAKAPVAKDVAGIRVVGQETYMPLATMCLLIGAGSRDESSTNTGVAAIVRRLAFKSTALHSQLAIAREFERMGSDLQASGSREATVVLVQSRREIARMVGMLSEELGGRLSPSTWEVDQCRKELAYEIDALTSDPVYLAIEGLHQAAFRGPMAQNVVPSKQYIDSVSYDDVLAFLDTHYTKANAVLAATGVPEEFFQLAEEAFATLPDKAKPVRQPAKYKGGRDVRIDVPSPTTTLALGFEAPAITSSDHAAATVLQYALGVGPVTKWGATRGLLGASVQGVIRAPVQVSAMHTAYSDTGLLAVLAVARTSDMGCVVGTVKETLAEVVAKGLSDEAVTRAKAQAKGALLVACESAAQKVEDMANQAFFTGKVDDPVRAADAVDDVTTDNVNKVAKTILSSKACMATVGNMADTPYLDQIGNA